MEEKSFAAFLDEKGFILLLKVEGFESSS